MKLYLIFCGLLLASEPVIGQKAGWPAAAIYATLQDSTVRKALDSAGHTQAKLFRIHLPDTVLWYSGNEIRPAGFKSQVRKKQIHHIDITRMRVKKGGHVKLKAVLDNKIKIRTNTRKQWKGHWVVSSFSVHTKNWFLNKGGYYYFSTLPACDCN